MAEKPKIRESGIELLRIILMLQVIFLHIGTFSGFETYSQETGTFQELFYWMNRLICRCPVYVFVMISGYFSVTSQTTMRNIWKKASNVYLPMIFYSITLTFVLGVTGVSQINTYDFVKSFFPLTSRTWYFMSVYLLVLILSPVVNLALTKLDKKDFRILLVVLFVLFSIWQNVAKTEPFNTVISVNSVIETTKGRGLYGFLFMYILGAYLRLHTKQEEKTTWKYLIIFVLLAAFDGILMYIVRDIPLLKGYLKIVNYNNAPIAVIQGLFLFLFFRTVRFKSKFINYISSHNLGVYMIHEHWLMRRTIWDRIFTFFQDPSFYESAFYPAATYGVILAIYISCIIIDIIRARIFDLIKKLYEKIKNKKHN